MRGEGPANIGLSPAAAKLGIVQLPVKSIVEERQHGKGIPEETPAAGTGTLKRTVIGLHLAMKSSRRHWTSKAATRRMSGPLHCTPQRMDSSRNQEVPGHEKGTRRQVKKVTAK